TAAGDENDPDKLQRAIEDAAASIEKKDVDIESAVMFVPVDQYYVLLRNDKLISGDYSTGNGDYANGMVLRSNGIRIVKTNRIPSAAISGHFLSNAGNNNAYDVTAAEAKAVAVILMPKALLAGETIPLTSDVYYDKPELQWFIDSYLAFGVTPNRAEVAAIVDKA
ncbi:MAG: capsid protein, partial [Desulfobulbaceae bacterium]|nr:capsid protein [Desulfobulbaceae bacterium]